MSVLVVLEQRGGKWNRTSFEALAAGQKIGQALATPVTAAVLGSNIDSLATEAAAFDIQKVFAIDDAALEQYTPDGYAAALEQLIQASTPKVVVFPHTYQVRDYAPKLATRFRKSLVSDVVDLKTVSGGLSYVRQLFQGKLNADIPAEGDLQFVSIQAGAFRAAEPASATNPIEQFRVSWILLPSAASPKPPTAKRNGQLIWAPRQSSSPWAVELKKKRTCPSSRRSRTP